MEIQFYKYQGTGNDFIMIDNRNLTFPKDNITLIKKMCDRRFGIGADGLILLENDSEQDFKMVYFNSDGNESTMCGNGGRSIVRFAHDLNLIGDETSFMAIDGKHLAKVDKEVVSLEMIDVSEIIQNEDGSLFLNTGSPHHIAMVSEIEHFPIYDFGKEIRYSNQYAPGGTNVNVVEAIDSDHYKVRTYERGVEDETLSCGTGATAVALGMHFLGKAKTNKVHIEIPGGNLTISFQKEGNKYTNIHLIGPAQFVFKGIWKV